MALTNAQVREILSAAGTPADAISEAVKRIIDGHVSSIDALREERDAYKTDAEKLPGVQKELDKLKENGTDGFQKKFEDEHTAFEQFKAQVAAEKTEAEKTNLYRQLLKSVNIDNKRIDSIIKVTDLGKLVVKDGKLDDEAHLKETAKTEWADFVSVVGRKGANVETPPIDGGKITKEDFGKLPLSKQMEFANEHPAQYAELLK